MAKYYFEDFKAGDRWDFGVWSVTREELIAFARQYDPHRRGSSRKGSFRRHYRQRLANHDEMHPLVRRPVDGGDRGHRLSRGGGRPLAETSATGDRIVSRVEVAETKSRPDRGRVHFLFSGVDQSGVPVMTCRGMFFVFRRQRVAR